MKTTIILISTFFLTASCLSRKTTQKMTGVSSDSRQVERSLVTFWTYGEREYDSSRMVWQFRTDAPFVYHPDTGLRAQNGNLMLSEWSTRQQNTLWDSSGFTRHVTDSRKQEEELLTISERHPVSQNWGWSIGIILLLLGGGYLVWRLWR